ncbi:CubicO group peptidase (beta-lactamase class C family) [Flavobacterium sp. 270]|uniref:serine hydrolase domain-containing protein n=1 Tax=Flavobacterium sp. 270 TaxID=2512114 RepID=UPI001065B522|nr:serine hydrolase domain-containing protein [Flavobacterium sp. 270]TDW51721.1 CubicO group peptidase (beta-lactamase class C family) [Flavobacterium sp. 270]
MKTFIYAVCILYFCPLNLFGQTTAMQLYFDELAKLKQHNGNLLLAENEKVIMNFTSGFADFQKNQKNTVNSSFNLASISKIITATAVLQLRDKGKLQLDEKVNKYLSDFPYKEITIRHLLTHTSGLPDLELFEDLVKQYPDTIVSNQNVIPELQKWTHGLYFKPGDEFRYCNTEYNVLALLIEKVSHKSFSDYLQKYIFDPAEMKDAYVNNPFFFNKKRNFVIAIPQMKPHPGYDSTFVPTDSISRFKYLTYNNNGTVGQANIICTTKDLLRFDIAYFKGKLLSENSIKEATMPIKLNNSKIYYHPNMDTMPGNGTMCYGLGWEIFDQPEFGKSVGHGGFKFGLATFYLHNLEKNQTIIGFDNTAGSEFGRFIFSSELLLNGLPPMQFRTQKSLVTLYGTHLVNAGANHAASIFNAHKADTAYYLNEGEMNDLGYNLFYMSSFNGHKELALEVFKLATFIFPDSFNTYDSFGQLLKDSNHTQDAILMYQKSLELNPDNKDGKRILSELLQINQLEKDTLK